MKETLTMHFRLPLILLLCLFWSGCASPAANSSEVERTASPLLNSERIELTFGSYGIDVLEQRDSLRVSNLYSMDGTRKICRTFAVVSYVRPVDRRISEEHRRIVAGGSMGAVFKSAGWQVEKQHRYFGAIQVQPKLTRVLNLMGPLYAEALAAHVYVLSAERERVSIAYATLVEVHHPDYLTLEDLHSLYDGEPAVDASLTDDLQKILEVAVREMSGS